MISKANIYFNSVNESNKLIIFFFKYSFVIPSNFILISTSWEKNDNFLYLFYIDNLWFINLL